MNLAAVDLSSFVVPLKQGAPRRRDALLFRIAIPLAIVASSLPAAYMFWLAYSTTGAMPWDHGFFRFSMGDELPWSMDGSVTVGLGWMFAIMPAVLVAFKVLVAVMARHGRELTAAGFAVFWLAGTLIFAIQMERALGSLNALGAASSAIFKEYAYTKKVLTEKGLTDEVKALDARLYKSLGVPRTAP